MPGWGIVADYPTFTGFHSLKIASVAFFTSEALLSHVKYNLFSWQSIGL